MTRTEKIEHLRNRIREAERNHWRKTWSLLVDRLQRLVLEQVKAETREDRRRAA